MALLLRLDGVANHPVICSLQCEQVAQVKANSAAQNLQNKAYATQCCNPKSVLMTQHSGWVYKQFRPCVQ